MTLSLLLNRQVACKYTGPASEYAKKWNLEINISKTKVLFFNKSNKTSRITWSIDNEIVEEVDSYTYLGVKFKKNGSLKNMLMIKVANACFLS